MSVKKSDLKIAWATHDSALYACKNWHYSRCLPVGKLVKVGAWEKGKFIGVVVFGRGASPNLGKKYNLGQDRSVELVRVALDKHITPVTRIVAIAIKFLKKANPKLKLIISFADTNRGHHGGIYQGGNWLYTGTSEGNTFYMIKGKLTHPRSVGAKCTCNIETVRKKLDPNATAVWCEGKHRYLMALDKETEKSIEKFRTPYPKKT